jgi:glycosyltransferase involved in cell wall biosynthesis
MKQGISVVVPTKGRIEYLEQLFISLQVAKTRITGSVQIIIVDDSPEKEGNLIRTLCENHGVEYYYYHGSVSDKRNFGVSQADFPLILFIDSDCWVHPDVLEEHLKSYTDANIGGCLGITEF